VIRDAAACPACHSGLRWSAADVYCRGCGATFALDDGIPHLVSGHPEELKRAQAGFFDEADPEWEIARPHGAPRWHKSLLLEKYRRGTGSLRQLVGGALTLVVCGGSGMDAELLARDGARVISSDIAPQAARRVRERARRARVEIEAIVADAERLPFRNRSVDLVYVHDGLHHLERPLAGLAEMARVARRAVSVNEPARAAVTRAAVRVGAALEVEPAGNRVARLDFDEVVGVLRTAGFEILRAERYGMLYRHEPGLPSRILSAPIVFSAARTTLGLANRVVGSVGNKLTIQAVRRDAA
jgi:SAM-dependent methyltransferase